MAIASQRANDAEMPKVAGFVSADATSFPTIKCMMHDCVHVHMYLMYLGTCGQKEERFHRPFRNASGHEISPRSNALLF